MSLFVVDLYCVYILLNLNIFSEKVREVYFGYVLNIVLMGFLFDDEELKLLDMLCIIFFIFFVDGCLKCVCFFFDLKECVFCIMLEEIEFLFLLF